MRREYRRWNSTSLSRERSLSREMEVLVSGHGGLPCLVVSTSPGRFFAFRERGMVDAMASRIEAGNLHLFCVDSLDAETWYNRDVTPRWRIARHLQNEAYLTQEAYLAEKVRPVLRAENNSSRQIAVGCSFDGHHSANLAQRHPGHDSKYLYEEQR